MVSCPNSSADLAAAIDLGSNSFHLVVGRIDGGQLRIVDKLRQRVRLAAGLDVDGDITPEAMDRALGCLERFGQRLEGMAPARVRVVGTNTLRRARNAREFLARARDALGHRVDIISGREEARLIYLGVAQSVAAIEGRRLVVDIGGGSTEIIIGEGFDIVEADSLYMGCVSFSERFFGGDTLSAKAFREAIMAARLELQSIVVRYVRRGWTAAIGCSGTVHAVHAIGRAHGWCDDAINPKAVKKLRKALVAAGRLEAVSLAGLEGDRTAVIAGGTAILEALAIDLRLETMTPSPGALREGVLYDLVGRIHHEDVRDRTIRWMQERYQVDVDRAGVVQDAALLLLHHAAPSWQLDEGRSAQLLSWAARLFEIGLTIAHTGYQKHGAYLVRNGYLAGFSREDQTAVAAIIANHRRKLRRSELAGLDVAVAEQVMRLCVLFRVAVRLNRGRDAQRPPCVLKVNRERLKLLFPAGWLDDHPLTQVALDEEARLLAGHGYALSTRSAN